MGIYDREYYRRDGPSFLGSFMERGAVCWWLVGINVAFFVAQMTTRVVDPHGHLVGLGWFTELLGLEAGKVLHGQVWRLLSYAFLHDVNSIGHILWNMLFLVWFGRDLEDVYGGREFLAFYLLAAVAGGVAHVLLTLLHVMPAGPPVLGASGAVTAVLALCALHFPTRIILVMLVLPVPIWLFVVFSVGKDFFTLVGGGATSVAVDVHVAGAAFAFVYYKQHWRILRWLPEVGTWRRRLARPRLRVYRGEEEQAPVQVAAPLPTPVPAGHVPDDDQLEARMDAILEKISRTGKESLTDGERQLLLRASEVFKRRRR